MAQHQRAHNASARRAPLTRPACPEPGKPGTLPIMPHSVLAPVLSVVPLVPNHYVLTCHAPDMAMQARPGHFVNVLGSAGGFDPFLRKPFSIYTADAQAGTISLLFSVVGSVSRGMSRLRAGDFVDLVGPLGGHVFAPPPVPDTLHILVGGGYGVPPLVFLSRALLQSRPAPELAFLIGARTKDLLLCEAELREAGVPTHTATDDGSHGTLGRVTDVLLPMLNAHAHRPVSVYCCGPSSMMQAVAQVCATQNVPCQLSVEVAMPCGIGVCMGCVLDLADGRRVRCCVDGPVFQAAEVAWN